MRTFTAGPYTLTVAVSRLRRWGVRPRWPRIAAAGGATLAVALLVWLLRVQLAEIALVGTLGTVALRAARRRRR